MPKIRVVIVDDSLLIRQVFKELLSSDPEIEVVGEAEDPYEAREIIKQHNPDVITLDIEMPRMDGISFLEKLMRLRPMPVVMASTLTQKGADITLRALELGAVDYISKPTQQQGTAVLRALKEELVTKVKTASKARVRSFNEASATSVSSELEKRCVETKKIIAIGASTGGVEALREVITRFPATVPPVVIVQHMPPVFTASFATRLNGLSAATVEEARDGLPLKRGTVYIAPGDKHLEVVGKAGAYQIRVREGERVSGHCPSVDVLFRSVAKNVGKEVVAAILTGMGKDGAEGLLEIRKAGAYTLGQNEASCVVYGMPKAAAQLGAVQKECSIETMAREIMMQL